MTNGTSAEWCDTRSGHMAVRIRWRTWNRGTWSHNVHDGQRGRNAEREDLDPKQRHEWHPSSAAHTDENPNQHKDTSYIFSLWMFPFWCDLFLRIVCDNVQSRHVRSANWPPERVLCVSWDSGSFYSSINRIRKIILHQNKVLYDLTYSSFFIILIQI